VAAAPSRYVCLGKQLKAHDEIRPMNIPVLLDNGHVRLPTGKLIAIPPEYFGFVASETSFTTTAPAAFGKLLSFTYTAEIGASLWSISKDVGCDISVEEPGTLLRLPGGVATFPLPVSSVVQAGRTVAVCLSTRPVLGRLPTEQEKRNPLIAVDFFGHELWRVTAISPAFQSETIQRRSLRPTNSPQKLLTRIQDQCFSNVGAISTRPTSDSSSSATKCRSNKRSSSRRLRHRSARRSWRDSAVSRHLKLLWMAVACSPGIWCQISETGMRRFGDPSNLHESCAPLRCDAHRAPQPRQTPPAPVSSTEFANLRRDARA